VVSAIAKVRLRSTGRATRASAANMRKFGRRRFRPVRKTVPVFSSHFCDFLDWRTTRGFARSRMLVLRIRARDGGSRWLGAEPRDAGTERRALPSFRRGGRADRRSRGRDGRVDRVARGGCSAVRGGHYLERTSLAPGTGGERTFTTGATTTRWPTKAEVASAATIFDWTGSNEAVCSSACGYVATIASGPAIQLEPYRAESADRVPERTGSARSCEETTTECPRRHQISGARRRACGDGAARGASSPRGG
jgi:hypothetical protein